MMGQSVCRCVTCGREIGDCDGTQCEPCRVGQSERSAYCERCGQSDYTDKRDPASWHVCPDEADERLLRTDMGDGPAITCLCGTNIRPLKPFYDPLRQGWLCPFCGRTVPKTSLEEVA